jgi:hypothetical protein
MSALFSVSRVVLALPKLARGEQALSTTKEEKLMPNSDEQVTQARSSEERIKRENTAQLEILKAKLNEVIRTLNYLGQQGLVPTQPIKEIKEL